MPKYADWLGEYSGWIDDPKGMHWIDNRPPPPGVALDPFPTGRARWRALAWYRRRRMLLFVAWYFLILLPAMVLCILAAKLHDLLGVGAVLAVGAVVFGASWILGIDSGRGKNMIIPDPRIDGGHFVKWYDDNRTGIRRNLREGAVKVLPPRGLGAHGKAWVLAHTFERLLLLTDPRTGLRRSESDLRMLIDALEGSAHHQDREAADTLRTLVHTVAPAEPDDTPAPVLWPEITAFLRVAAVAVVGATVHATGAILTADYETWLAGALLELAAIVFAVIWAFYVLLRAGFLLGAVRRAIAAYAQRRRP